MTDLYNLTSIDQANNILEIVQGINTLSNWWLGNALLFLTFFVAFLVFKKYEDDAPEAMITASTVTLILGIMFAAVELVKWHTIIFPLLILIGTLFYYMVTK